ncbi:MAG: radical SAM family heme chaperone HemW [Gammaproteobacteria bacterium]|nr:radical SAM family heme chaperone HemW [Gammaproteobacteria bacterium]
MPWCVRKCPYCDFNSHALKAARPDARYLDALAEDLRLEVESGALDGRSIASVFFGGGTPSLFGPEDFSRLLEALRAHAPLAADAEITLEANPGAVERGAFAAYRRAGINRVSLGAQSFDAKALAALGRIHSPEETRRAAEELHAAGITNFNLDLMYGLPDQTRDGALADVRAAIALAPAHLSHYQLTLEPGTVFHARPPALPDEETTWSMQLECQSLLAEAGYAQYEVSAYSRPGQRCRHNLNYWQFGDYLGIGAGAHGKLSARRPDRILRTEKPRMPTAYLGAVTEAVAAPPGSAPPGTRSAIALEELPFEYLLNALRLNEGFSAGDFQARTGLPVDVIAAALARAERRGLLAPPTADQVTRPSDLGRRFLNDLLTLFLP